MPLNRTPPASPSINPTVSISSTKVTVMEPSEESSSRNVTTRSKKKREDDEPNSLICEIKSMLKVWQEQQDKKFDALQKIVQEIKVQNNLISTSIEFISKQYDDIKERMDIIEREKRENQGYIQILEDRLELLEKNNRQTSFEIRNIPVIKTENKETLANLVVNAGKTLNLNIQTSDMRDIYRIKGKNGPTSTVIVELASVILKENFLKSYKTYNKEHRDDKFNTVNLKIDGPSTPLYIAENLTPKMKRLYYLSRNFVRMNNYAYCWTVHGKIFIREKEGCPSIRIQNDNDLSQLTK